MVSYLWKLGKINARIVAIDFIMNLLLFAADILEKIAPRFDELGLTYECLGGGRIKHNNDAKRIKVYGYSVVSYFPLSYFLAIIIFLHRALDKPIIN